jgi:hypothetical protein
MIAKELIGPARQPMIGREGFIWRGGNTQNRQQNQQCGVGQGNLKRGKRQRGEVLQGVPWLLHIRLAEPDALNKV